MLKVAKLSFSFKKPIFGDWPMFVLVSLSQVWKQTWVHMSPRDLSTLGYQRGTWSDTTIETFSCRTCITMENIVSIQVLMGNVSLVVLSWRKKPNADNLSDNRFSRQRRVVELREDLMEWWICKQYFTSISSQAWAQEIKFSSLKVKRKSKVIFHSSYMKSDQFKVILMSSTSLYIVRFKITDLNLQNLEIAHENWLLGV